MSAPRRSLRFTHHEFDSAIRLHYAELPSDNPPMLLVHGIGMDWRVWQAVSRRLSPHFHLYLLDLRGHGQSEKPPRGYTLAHYAADIEDLLDALGLEGVTLVGSSLGGAVAAAVEAPEDLVSFRVLVDPPLTGGPVRDVAMFQTILSLKHGPPSELAGFLAAQNPDAGRYLVSVMAEMWQRAADGVIEDMLAAPDDYFALDSALSAIDSPTLLMRADPARGGVLGEEQAQRAVALLPNGAYRYFPGAGHAIHGTKPAEFVQAVLSFASGGLS